MLTQKRRKPAQPSKTQKTCTWWCATCGVWHEAESVVKEKPPPELIDRLEQVHKEYEQLPDTVGSVCKHCMKYKSEHHEDEDGLWCTSEAEAKRVTAEWDALWEV